METWLKLYPQEVSGKRPHYKLICKIDGVEHEAAFWPATDKEGNPIEGFSGKLKPKEKYVPKEAQEGIKQLQKTVDEEIPF